MNNYSESTYQNISKAVTLNDFVIVEFENGDVVKFQVKNNDIVVRVTTVTYTPHEIVINPGVDDIVYPWDNIRYLTDARYQKYMNEIGLVWNKQVGIKIKMLRARKQFDHHVLAKSIDMDPERWVAIEEGEALDINFEIVTSMLKTMGFSMKSMNIH